MKRILVENQRIDWLLESPAFLQKRKKGKDEKESYWHAYNLIPNKEQGYSIAEHCEYNYKMLCHQAAKENQIEYELFYYQRSLVEVYETILRIKAYNYIE